MSEVSVAVSLPPGKAKGAEDKKRKGVLSVICLPSQTHSDSGSRFKKLSSRSGKALSDGDAVITSAGSVGNATTGAEYGLLNNFNNITAPDEKKGQGREVIGQIAVYLIGANG